MSSLIKTVLFDLDGTFADTAPDLAYALNETLKANAKPPLSFAQIRPHVSHGTRALIELGFSLAPDHPEFSPLRQQLIDIYTANLTRETVVFPGIMPLLDELTKRQLRWGIVTNKPGHLTEPLLRELGCFDQASTIVSGDTLPQRKPHPAPLLHACRQSGGQPAECVYIGDAERDIVAGKHAGMHTLVALFGYLASHDRPQDWGADDLINSPQEIVEWIDKQNQPRRAHDGL